MLFQLSLRTTQKSPNHNVKKGLAMGIHKNNQGDTAKSVRFKRSMLAMCVMAVDLHLKLTH
jgi:hypothetical protein